MWRSCLSICLLSLLLFCSPAWLLPRLPDWTVSPGAPASDCYLCLIRHCAAEPNNTLPLRPEPSLVTLPHWCCAFLSAPFLHACVDSHCSFAEASNCNRVALSDWNYCIFFFFVWLIGRLHSPVFNCGLQVKGILDLSRSSTLSYGSESAATFLWPLNCSTLLLLWLPFQLPFVPWCLPYSL